MGCNPSQEDAEGVGAAAGKAAADRAMRGGSSSSSSRSSDSSLGRLSSSSSSSSSKKRSVDSEESDSETSRSSDDSSRRARKRKRRKRRNQKRRASRHEPMSGGDDTDNESERSETKVERARRHAYEKRQARRRKDRERRKKEKARKKRRGEDDDDEDESDDPNKEPKNKKDPVSDEGGCCCCKKKPPPKKQKKKRKRRHGEGRTKEDKKLIEEAEQGIAEELAMQKGRNSSSNGFGANSRNRKFQPLTGAELQKMTPSQLRDEIRARDTALFDLETQVQQLETSNEEAQKDSQQSSLLHKREIDQKELRIRELELQVQANRTNSLGVPTPLTAASPRSPNPPRSFDDSPKKVAVATSATQTDVLPFAESASSPKISIEMVPNATSSSPVSPHAPTKSDLTAEDEQPPTTIPTKDMQELVKLGEDACSLLITGKYPAKLKMRLIQHAITVSTPPVPSDVIKAQIKKQREDDYSGGSNNSSPLRAVQPLGVVVPTFASAAASAQSEQGSTTTTTLSLDFDAMEAIGDDAALIALAVVHRNPLVEELHLGRCGITDAGATALAAGLMHMPNKIRFLNVSANRLTNDGAFALIDALVKTHRRRMFLNLEANGNIWRTSPDRCARLREGINALKMWGGEDMQVLVHPEPPSE